MADPSGVAAAQPPPEPAGTGAAEKRRKLYARISMGSSFVLLAVAVIRLASCVLTGPTLAQCDDSKLQASLKSSIETAAHTKVTSVTNIRTISRTDKTATCAMHVTGAVGPPADITYRLDLDKSGTLFRVLEVK